MFQWIENFYFETVDGVEYHLDNLYRALMSFGDFGMPDLEFQTQRGPYQHGETLLDYRLKPLIIQLVIREDRCDRQAYWDARAEMLNHFRPNRHPYRRFQQGVFHVVQPDGIHRALRCIVSEGPKFVARDPEKWDEWGFTETVRFIAHDPIWFDPTVHYLRYFDTVNLGQWVLPFTFRNTQYAPSEPTLIFGLYGNQIQGGTIHYDGTWSSYPILRLTGPVKNPIITNTGTGEYIQIAVELFDSSDKIMIDTSFGYKKVYWENNPSGNLIGYVVPGSSLATFAIQPDPQTPGGDNTILLSGENIEQLHTNLEIWYYSRFIGI